MAQKTALVGYHIKGSIRPFVKTIRMRVEPTKADAIRVIKRKHPNWVINNIDFD